MIWSRVGRAEVVGLGDGASDSFDEVRLQLAFSFDGHVPSTLAKITKVHKHHGRGLGYLGNHKKWEETYHKFKSGISCLS